LFILIPAVLIFYDYRIDLDLLNHSGPCKAG